MTNDTKILIRQITQGDLQKIKQAAICVLRNDKTQKDAAFCNQMIAQLEAQKNFINLPKNLSEFLVVENPEETFIPERYFLTEANKTLLEDIIAVNKVADSLLKKRIRYVNSTLLHGESGTGKTTFGRCVAYEMELPFIYINFSSLISSLLGETGKRLNDIFKFACNQRCVLMIDEIDAIGTTRGSSRDTSEISRIAISLMQALDTLGNNVVLLGATNRINDIDPAIRRRFTRTVEIKPFKAEENIAFAKKYFADCGYSVSDVVLDSLTKDTTPAETERNIISLIVRLELQEKQD